MSGTVYALAAVKYTYFDMFWMVEKVKSSWYRWQNLYVCAPCIRSKRPHALTPVRCMGIHFTRLLFIFFVSFFPSVFFLLADRWPYVCEIGILVFGFYVVTFTSHCCSHENNWCMCWFGCSFIRSFIRLCCMHRLIFYHTLTHSRVYQTYTHKRNKIFVYGWFNMLRLVRFELAARSELRNASYDMNAVCMDRQHAATHRVYTPYTFVWFLSHLSIQLMLILCWGRIVNVRANSVHKFIHSNHTENSHSHRFSI